MTDKIKGNSAESDTELRNMTGERQKKCRPYTRPQVLSSERLEAAAATCAPPAGGFGKHTPFPCGIMGS